MYELRRKKPVSGEERDAELLRLDALVAELAEVERLICALQVRQVLVSAELVEGARVLDFGAGDRWATGSDRPVALQIAHARHLSVDAAERYLFDAVTLGRDLPCVLDVLEAGETTLEAVRAVCREGVNVQVERKAEYDSLVAGDLRALPVASHARTAARRRAFELNPSAAQEATEAARRERFVTVQPSVGVAMASLTAVLPADQAAHCHAVLDHDARLLRHDGDPRTTSQLMVDLLVERVAGLSTAQPVPVSVGVVMGVDTLLGLDDRPAELTGHGPIPAAAARLLATSDNAWLRRLFTDPVDGTVAQADTGRRRFDGALRDFVLARDQHCRAPGCTQRVRHLDHDHDYAAGGPTTASNGRGYDIRCHTVKHSPGIATEVHARPGSSHSAYTRWVLPFGPALGSIPPPALGYGSTSEQQNVARRTINELVGLGSPGP